MFPEMLPAVAEALMRAVIVVIATLPLVGVSVNVGEKVVPSFDSSTPAGAVIVMGADRLVPATVNVCVEPAVPAMVVPRLNDAGLTVMVAVAAGFTLAVTVTF